MVDRSTAAGFSCRGRAAVQPPCGRDRLLAGLFRGSKIATHQVEACQTHVRRRQQRRARGGLQQVLLCPSARLRISRATFYREVERGRIRTVPIGRGRSRRVTPKAIAEYVQKLDEEADEGL